MTLFETIFMIVLAVFAVHTHFRYLVTKEDTQKHLNNQKESTEKEINSIINIFDKVNELNANDLKVKIDRLCTMFSEEIARLSHKIDDDIDKCTRTINADIYNDNIELANSIEADISRIRKHLGLPDEEENEPENQEQSIFDTTEYIQSDLGSNLLQQNTPVEILQNQVEFFTFLRYFKELDPKHVVEIGSFFGGTLYHFIKEVKLESISSIDLHIPESDGRYQQMIDSKAKWNEWEREFGIEIKRYIGDSKDEAIIQSVYNLYGKFEEDDMEGSHKNCNEGVVDMLFIDGDHSYEGLKADFENYFGIVKKGGIIVIHDIACIADVNDFWNEIVSSGKYKTKKFIAQENPMGIGVIIV